MLKYPKWSLIVLLLCANHYERKKNVFDRELCSKVLNEALLFLFLAWNQKQKMFKGTENAQGNKKCAYVTHYGIELSCLPCMAFLWSFLAVIDPNSFGHVNGTKMFIHGPPMACGCQLMLTKTMGSWAYLERSDHCA